MSATTTQSLVVPTYSPCPMTYQQLKDLVAIDPLSIEKEFEKLPVYVQMVTEETARLAQEVQAYKLQIEVRKAQAMTDIRKANEASGKKITVGEVDALVDLDDELIDLRLKHLNADGEYQKWYALKQAWAEKSNCARAIKELIVTGYVSYKVT